MAPPSAPPESESSDRIPLETAPPPYSEIAKNNRFQASGTGASPDLDTLEERIRRRRVKKARRKVRYIKVGAACLVILLFLMSLM